MNSRPRWPAMSMREPPPTDAGVRAARGLYARGRSHAGRRRWRGAAARASSRFPIRRRLRPPNRQVRHEPRYEPRQQPTEQTAVRRKRANRASRRHKQTAMERAGRASTTFRKPDAMSTSWPMRTRARRWRKRSALRALPRLEASFDVEPPRPRRFARGRPRLGDGRANLRGDARADRERGRGGGRSRVRAGCGGRAAR